MMGLSNEENDLLKTLLALEMEKIDETKKRLQLVCDLATAMKRRSQLENAAKAEARPDELSRLLAGMDAATKMKAVRLIKRMSTKRPHRFDQPSLAIV